jgi:nifR3 family TIM-barrel protein
MLPWFSISPCPLFLAPMAGFTDPVFRSLCKRFGADVVVTEFVQSEGLVRGGERVWEPLEFSEEQRPIGMQIFGAKPEYMERAAQLIAERLQPDFIDLNFGCPAVNVVEQNAGAGLLREPELLEKIAAGVVRAVPGVAVTAKMRIGWSGAEIVAVDVARRLEGAGVRMITVHGRTRAQGYSGQADWAEISRVAAAVQVPVVGNGDIRDGAGAMARWRESGVAGLMVGRGAQGNPWVFAEIKAALAGQPAPVPPSDTERRAMLCTYASALVARRAEGREGGTGTDIRWILTRLQPFTRGIAGGRLLRAGFSSCRTLEDVLRFVGGAQE